MPRFLIVDTVGDGLSIAARLMDEGAEVLHYVHARAQDEIGKNLVPKIGSLHQAFAWAKEKPTIAFYMFSGMGKRGPDKHRLGKDIGVGADDFRAAGVPVIGASAFCDRLEYDRAFGFEIAQTAGARIPPTKSFANISQAIAFAQTLGNEPWYFKSDKTLEADATYGAKNGADLARNLEAIRKEFGDKIPCALQQKVPGVAISTECWWNGQSFIGPFLADIEHKKFMNDEVGPSTGCAFNSVWAYKEERPRIAGLLHWDGLTELFRKHNAPPSVYDMNAIIAEKSGPWGPVGEAYFLEFCARNGWDSEPTAFRLLETPMVDFLEGLVNAKLERVPFSTKEIAYSTRLSVSPYPFEHCSEQKHSAYGTPIYGADGLWDGNFIAYSVAMNDEGELYAADRSGCIGLSLATGTNLSSMHDEVIAFAKDELEVKGLQYRSDGAKCVQADAKRLKEHGIEVPAAVLQ